MFLALASCSWTKEEEFKDSNVGFTVGPIELKLLVESSCTSTDKVGGVFNNCEWKESEFLLFIFKKCKHLPGRFRLWLF